MKHKRAWPSLLIFIVLCLGVEVLASYWTNQTVSTWYPNINKPFWTPPGWVFGPVWTILYIMIAISGWLIYQAKHSPQRSIALAFYGGQLALNLIWSFFFFSLRSPLSGLVDIILLFLLIILTITSAWSVRSLASILLIPYLIWVMYAATLNAGIWLLNG
jgi:translocator protein